MVERPKYVGVTRCVAFCLFLNASFHAWFPHTPQPMCQALFFFARQTRAPYARASLFVSHYRTVRNRSTDSLFVSRVFPTNSRTRF